MIILKVKRRRRQARFEGALYGCNGATRDVFQGARGAVCSLALVDGVSGCASRACSAAAARGCCSAPSRMLAVDYFNPKHAAWRCAPAL